MTSIKAAEIREQERVHALLATAGEVDRAMGVKAQESAARLEESPMASATPMSRAIAAVERRIEALDRLMANLEKQRLAARARWEMAAANYYANAQEKALAHRRELVELIAKSQKV